MHYTPLCKAYLRLAFSIFANLDYEHSSIVNKIGMIAGAAGQGRSKCFSIVIH
ncbi:MAG: hypothetical protein H0V82_06435 [Candidatus Protochlamydia sp.]|nr:hypothetical protein [Candidatus Protochlamydia sp.]